MNWKPIKSHDFLIVHCSATPADMDVGAAEIDRWHRQRGWLGIGYHYVIRRDGSVETGRPEEQPGAHVRGFNHRSLGVCMIGGVDQSMKPEANFTDEQYRALEALLTDLSARYPAAEVRGHRDMPGVHKACPSFDAMKWWEGGVEGVEQDDPPDIPPATFFTP